jgi:redox-sensitive bicupin YhaK (pirin superfamily)
MTLMTFRKYFTQGLHGLQSPVGPLKHFTTLKNKVNYYKQKSHYLNLMKTIFHSSASRGHANHGWLKSHHSFSFANYYNPEKIHFGALRVLNDDIVAGGMGFGEHPHQNMEIISIPLEGDLEHKDSMGNITVIKHGEIQVMSAGTGVYHSEYNKSKSNAVKFLQIWVIPNKQNVTPRYDQITLNLKDRENKLQQILSPNKNDDGVWIHQDAWFHLGKFSAEKNCTYNFKKEGNGVYFFLLKGKAIVAGEELNERDAIGIWECNSFDFKSLSYCEILMMEVPMI